MGDTKIIIAVRTLKTDLMFVSGDKGVNGIHLTSIYSCKELCLQCTPGEIFTLLVKRLQNTAVLAVEHVFCMS